MFYYDGLDGEVDYQKAKMWYEKSAQQGVAAAVNNLAVLYEKGEGVQQDEEKPLICIDKQQIWVQQLPK